MLKDALIIAGAVLAIACGVLGWKYVMRTPLKGLPPTSTSAEAPSIHTPWLAYVEPETPAGFCVVDLSQFPEESAHMDRRDEYRQIDYQERQLVAIAARERRLGVDERTQQALGRLWYVETNGPVHVTRYGRRALAR